MPPIPITRAEYEAKYGIKPVISTSTLDTTPAPIRITRAEYDALYRPEAQKTGVIESIAQGKPAFPADTTGGAETILPNIARTVGNLPGATFNLAKGTVETINKANPYNLNNDIYKSVGVAGEIFKEQGFKEGTKNIIDTLGDSGKTGFELWKTAGEEIYKNLEQNVGYTESVKEGVGLSTAQAVSKVAEVVLNDPTLVPSLLWSPKVVGKEELISTVAKPVIETTKNIATPIVDSLKSRAITKSEEQLFNIENNYAVTRKAKEYSKDEGVSSRKRIVNSGVLDNGAVDTDGLIRTKGQGGAIEKYKAQTIDGVESVVRDNLIRENKTINLQEVENYLKLKIAESGLEGGDLVNALGGVKKELEGLQLRADGLGNVPLAKIHDAKISTTNNIDFNTPAETKTYRKSVAKGYKELVEKKSDFNVKEVNSVLSMYYDDITRLENLDGKRAKGGKLGKYFAQTAGTMIGMGAGSVGGGVGAALGGMVGGEVASMIKGQAMAGSLKGGGTGLAKNPILEKAKADSKLPAERPLTQPDPKLGAPKNLPKTKEVFKLEKDIARNVEAQKKAIKAGDFTLVATLKEIYDVLVQALKDLVKEIKTNNKGMVNFGAEIPKKLSESEMEKTLDELMSYDSSPVTIAKRDGTISTGVNKTLELGSDDNFRLSQLRDKSIEKALTNAEIVEANTLLKKVGLIEKTSVKQKSSTLTNKPTPIRTPDNKRLAGSKSTKNSLEQEAKKYKSAEEFIKKQPLAYHGTTENLKKFDKRGTWFTDDYMNADGYAFGENIYEGYLDLKNPLVIDGKGKKWDDLDTPYGKSTQEIVGKVDQKKYDGVIFKNIKDNWIDDVDYQDPGTVMYAFNPQKSFLNESQLTDIYNKANGIKPK